MNFDTFSQVECQEACKAGASLVTGTWLRSTGDTRWEQGPARSWDVFTEEGVKPHPRTALEELTWVLTLGSDLCLLTLQSPGEARGQAITTRGSRVATPAASIRAGNAGGDLVGGFHH